MSRKITQLQRESGAGNEGEYMSKIKVVGEAMVLRSELTVGEIKVLQKYNPKALVLLGGEDEKEEIFAVGVGNNATGSISKFGITFGDGEDDSKATVTLLLDGVEKDKDKIADKYGMIVTLLNRLEGKVPDAIDKVKADRERVKNLITLE